jgi:hypothetical protein
MLRTFPLDLELQRRQYQKSAVQHRYAKLRREARSRKENRQYIDDLFREEQLEIDIIDDDISQLQTQIVLTQLDAFYFPAPEFDEKSGVWTRSEFSDKWSLSRQTVIELRKLIRMERKERYEALALWLTPLTGIVGALTGLIAVMASVLG